MFTADLRAVGSKEDCSSLSFSGGGGGDAKDTIKLCVKGDNLGSK